MAGRGDAGRVAEQLAQLQRPGELVGGVGTLVQAQRSGAELVQRLRFGAAVAEEPGGQAYR